MNQEWYESPCKGCTLHSCGGQSNTCALWRKWFHRAWRTLRKIYGMSWSYDEQS